MALAIHAVDRLIKRAKEIPLSFRIVLPVRNIDVFIRSDVQDFLTRVLEWYTNDSWCFEFSKREVLGRSVEFQAQIPWGSLSSKKIEVALWSGGLDSLSGLYTRLIARSHVHHILVGTGSNSQVHKKQRYIAIELDHLFPTRTSLVQIPYRWHKTPLLEKNFSQRSRGLVFALIGAACAHYMGCSSLFIYENGIGAINLPYSMAEVGLDQAKSVHPISLLCVSELVTCILGTPFQIENPYWLWTKAQMVKSLMNPAGESLISLSSSCDRIRRIKGVGVVQCGVCSSCLLRRQSLSVLGFDDSNSYNNKYINRTELYLSAMQYQIDKIRVLLKQENPWVNLSREYHDLDNIADQISQYNQQDVNCLRAQIVQLYSNYVDEWEFFEEYINKMSQVV